MTADRTIKISEKDYTLICESLLISARLLKEITNNERSSSTKKAVAQAKIDLIQALKLKLAEGMYKR